MCNGPAPTQCSSWRQIRFRRGLVRLTKKRRQISILARFQNDADLFPGNPERVPFATLTSFAEDWSHGAADHPLVNSGSRPLVLQIRPPTRSQKTMPKGHNAQSRSSPALIFAAYQRSRVNVFYSVSVNTFESTPPGPIT